MASALYHVAIVALFVQFVNSHDTAEHLLKSLNSYRASLNLPSLTENHNAECLADQIADQFKDRPCTNTTGANTVPGTEDQFPNFPDFLHRCHLNATVTQDAAIMPVCVPGHKFDLVLSNYTKSQYSGSLNDSRFVGAGIADEDDWVVVVLTTNSSTGNFSPATGAGCAVTCSFSFSLMALFLASLVLLK